MTPGKRFRVLYGAGPLHLLALLASFALAGAAVIGWFERPKDVVTVLIWLAAAVILHDLILMPLYSLLDRIAFARLISARHERHGDHAGSANPTPYVRIPAVLSGLLLLVFFPVIFGLGANTELTASGIPEDGYLVRWLLLSGVLFAGSGAAYAVKAAALRRADRGPTPSASGAPGSDDG